MRIMGSAVTVLALVALASGGAAAQQDGSKFYAGLGFAYGQYDLAADGYSLNSTYKSNISYYGEIGMRLRPSLALGFEADYYTKSSGGVSVNTWFYNAALAYYPSANPFWIKVLAGYASTTGSGLEGSEGGFAMGLGAGYDWHPKAGSSFAIVPFIQYVAQLSGGSFANDPGQTKFEARLWQIGGAIAIGH